MIIMETFIEMLFSILIQGELKFDYDGKRDR